MIEINFIDPSFFDAGSLKGRFTMLLLALLLDYYLGEPAWLWRYIPHPVVLMGRAIAFFDKELNKEDYTDIVRKNYGMSLAFFLPLTVIFIGLLIGFLGFWVELVVVFTLLAGKSLIDHLQQIAKPLKSGDIESAKLNLSMIVGRNTADLKSHQIAKASVESGAESLCDGVIAPIFWFIIGGLPLLLAYKVINSCDSMIGYKNKKYIDFGYGAAKVDDLMNLLPARMTGFLIVFLAPMLQGKMKTSYHVLMANHHNHSSPNAGWSEAAIAGVLNLRLGGPRAYGENYIDAKWIHQEGAQKANYRHILKVVFLIHMTYFLLMLMALISATIL